MRINPANIALRHACLWTATLALAFAAIGAPDQNQKLDWDVAADRVSADLLDASLESVLERVRIATGWEVAVEPGIEHSVSSTFEGLESGRALERLLRDSNFALIQRTNRPARLLVFKTSRDRATKEILRDAEGDGEGEATRIDDEWIVTVKPGTDIKELARKLGAKVTGRIDKLGAYRLKFETADAARTAKSLLDAESSVDRVDANYAINRPNEMQPLSYAGSRLPQIKPVSGGDGKLIIGIVDTAIQIPKGELGEFFLPPVSMAGDYTPSGNAPTHATGMGDAAMIAIAAMLGRGSPANFQFLSVDVFGANDTTSTFQLGQGMVEAWNGGATLINGSIGSKADSAWLDEVISRLTGYGAVIVAPAGNTPDGLPTYPAANPNVLAVTAVGPDGRLASYANMAPFVDVAMPGGSIVTLTGSPYYMSGTSVSTALATGTVAGYALQTGQGIASGQNFLLQTHSVRPGTQISP